MRIEESTLKAIYRHVCYFSSSTYRLFLIFIGHPGPAIQARVCLGTSDREVSRVSHNGADLTLLCFSLEANYQMRLKAHARFKCHVFQWNLSIPCAGKPPALEAIHLLECMLKHCLHIG
jgi:hypothetical protein